MVDTDNPKRKHRTAEILLVVGLVVVVGLVAFVGGAAANHDGDGDFTVELPDSEDHEPGNRNASANFLIENTKQFDVLTDIEATYPDGVPSRCYNGDTRVFGIDRGSTYSGTGTDESAIPYASDTERTKHTVLMEFYKEEDTEPSIHLDAGDEFVVSVETCVWHPEEPGWYQLQATIMGRTPADEMESVSFASHYFYVCNCENEQEAREQLGPPPNERPPTPTTTATATPTVTPTATSTATATPTATLTATATPEPTAEQSTPTPTLAATEPPTSTAQRTATRSGSRATPTAGDGPGFGVMATLAALVGVGIGSLRRLR
jgi:hypothetical protein